MLLVLITWVLTAAAPSPPLSDEQVRERVEQYLGAIDQPVPASLWKELGPRAAAPLQEVAQDSAALPSRRAKAVFGLAAVSEEKAAPSLESLAQDRKAPPLVRQSAVRGLGAVLPPAQLVKNLRPYLEDPDVRLRAVSAEVLSRQAPAEACPLLKAQLAKETSKLSSFSQAQKRCEKH